MRCRSPSRRPLSARRCRRAPGAVAASRRAPQQLATVDSPHARQLAGSMPGRAAHQEAAAAGGPEPTAAGGSAGAAAQQEQRGLAGAFPLVLKKLMENPPREARLGERGSARHLPASPPFFLLLASPCLPAPRLGGRDPVGRGGTGCGVRGGSTRARGRTPGPGVLPRYALCPFPPPRRPAAPSAGSTESQAVGAATGLAGLVPGRLPDPASRRDWKIQPLPSTFRVLRWANPSAWGTRDKSGRDVLVLFP